MKVPVPGLGGEQEELLSPAEPSQAGLEPLGRCSSHWQFLPLFYKDLRCKKTKRNLSFCWKKKKFKKSLNWMCRAGSWSDPDPQQPKPECCCCCFSKLSVAGKAWVFSHPVDLKDIKSDAALLRKQNSASAPISVGCWNF